MKLALAAIVAFCLSSVQTIKAFHKQEVHKNGWQSPCEVGDQDCWANLGENCDQEDNECMAIAMGVSEDNFPDCENDDDDCWQDFWTEFFNNYFDENESHNLNHIKKSHQMFGCRRANCARGIKYH